MTNNCTALEKSKVNHITVSLELEWEEVSLSPLVAGFHNTRAEHVRGAKREWKDF